MVEQLVLFRGAKRGKLLEATGRVLAHAELVGAIRRAKANDSRKDGSFLLLGQAAVT